MTNFLITGGTSGLGRALVLALAARGDTVTTDARRSVPLEELRSAVDGTVTALVGDVTDPEHRRELVTAAAAYGPIDVLVNNASELGGSPQPALRDLESATFERLWRTNVDGPLQLIRAARPHLADTAVIINVSSDAAADHYSGWGGYGATKAALDHLTLTAAAEEPHLAWYALDPGDMRTPMHQAAFPDEDISDRPEPATVVPRLLALLGSRPPSGRYRASDLGVPLAPVGVSA